MKIAVPSGIGDVSWIYSKLGALGLEWEVSDGWPARTVPYLEMLPGIKKATYGGFQYNDILRWQQAVGILDTPRWSDCVALEAGTLYMSANRHLELGRRLEDWCPDLSTDFHYEIRVESRQTVKAAALLEGMRRPIFGISAASYRGSEAWKTWRYEQWSHFLRMLLAHAGGSVLLLGGFWDDLTSSLVDDGYRDVVGKTDVGTCVEILRNIEGYIGFSSGLGVIRTVLNKPAFCLWPDHQVELSTSWAPMHMIESGRYEASLWREPEDVMRRVKAWLKTLP